MLEVFNGELSLHDFFGCILRACRDKQANDYNLRRLIISCKIQLENIWLNRFGHLFIKAGITSFSFGLFCVFFSVLFCCVWCMGADFGFIWKKRRPRRRAYGAATSRSRSLTLASCSRSRFVVAKGERHGVTQAWSKSEGLATGERPKGTQAMSKPKVCERRGSVSD